MIHIATLTTVTGPVRPFRLIDSPTEDEGSQSFEEYLVTEVVFNLLLILVTILKIIVSLLWGFYKTLVIYFLIRFTSYGIATVGALLYGTIQGFQAFTEATIRRGIIRSNKYLTVPLFVLSGTIAGLDSLFRDQIEEYFRKSQ